MAARGSAAGQRPAATPSVPQESVTYSYHMNSGLFAGQDPRDLVQQAIGWWGEQLDKIEQDAAALP